MTDSHFKGYVAHDKKAIGNLKYEPFQPKNWTEDDVEIKVRQSTSRSLLTTDSLLWYLRI